MSVADTADPDRSSPWQWLEQGRGLFVGTENPSPCPVCGLSEFADCRLPWIRTIHFARKFCASAANVSRTQNPYPLRGNACLVKNSNLHESECPRPCGSQLSNSCPGRKRPGK
jgi:hypothetical protein